MLPMYWSLPAGWYFQPSQDALPWSGNGSVSQPCIFVAKLHVSECGSCKPAPCTTWNSSLSVPWQPSVSGSDGCCGVQELHGRKTAPLLYLGHTRTSFSVSCDIWSTGWDQQAYQAARSLHQTGLWARLEKHAVIIVPNDSSWTCYLTLIYNILKGKVEVKRSYSIDYLSWPRLF